MLKALRDCLSLQLLGKYSGSVWPLTKVLDIGGPARNSTLGSVEAPPIPVHIHSGEVHSVIFSLLSSRSLLMNVDSSIHSVYYPFLLQSFSITTRFLILHSVKDGSMDIKTGKLEAYWFPPLSLPPYNKDLSSVRTRLGLMPGVTKEQFIEALKVSS